MAEHSDIEWTESTWNPITGCTKVSTGCKNCYAERMAKRLKAMGQPNYKNGFQLTIHDHALEIPLTWKKPQVIFVNSMSDLFHEDVPLDFILKIFDIMRAAHWHTFQILTKRSNRLKRLNYKLDWADNIWVGVSIEDQSCTHRLYDLVETNASVKFLSLEPLLSNLDNLQLENIDWVIAGGESGPGARPMEKEWVINIRNQCIRSNTPFFFKQWGGVRKKKNGYLLEGKIWNQVPEFV